MVLRPVLSPRAASVVEPQPRSTRSAATALVFSPVGGGAQPDECNPMYLRLQPFASQAATVHAQAVQPHHTHSGGGAQPDGGFNGCDAPSAVEAGEATPTLQVSPGRP